MPAMHLMSVDLPAPLSPTSAMTSPERDLEVDVCQRLHGAERLREIPDLKERSLAHGWKVPSTYEWRRQTAPPLIELDSYRYLQYFLYSPVQTSLRFRTPSLKRRV